MGLPDGISTGFGLIVLLEYVYAWLPECRGTGRKKRISKSDIISGGFQTGPTGVIGFSAGLGSDLGADGMWKNKKDE